MATPIKISTKKQSQIPFEIDGKQYLLDVENAALIELITSGCVTADAISKKMDKNNDIQTMVQSFEMMKALYMKVIDTAFGAGSWDSIFGNRFPYETAQEIFQAITDQVSKYAASRFGGATKRE